LPTASPPHAKASSGRRAAGQRGSGQRVDMDPPVTTPFDSRAHHERDFQLIRARADLYATGAVLFECLTGRIVFPSQSVTALIAKHLEEKPADPRTLNREVPPALAEAVLRALAKKPADRWASAGELAEALEKIAAA